MDEEIGIREARQSLSVYLGRVKAGERFVITERGKPVAALGPPPDSENVWDRLIAEGLMTPPTAELDDLPPPIELDDPYGGTKALREQRRERP